MHCINGVNQENVKNVIQQDTLTDFVKGVLVNTYRVFSILGLLEMIFHSTMPNAVTKVVDETS